MLESSSWKPNKRFLTTIIKSVDGHNHQVIQSQAVAARDAREERFYNDGFTEHQRRTASSSHGAGALSTVKKVDKWAHDHFDRADEEYRERKRIRKDDASRELEEQEMNGEPSKKRDKHRSERKKEKSRHHHSHGEESQVR